MSNYSVGHDAEKRAAEYLKSLGFRVKELNWKTRYCEIDIIAELSNTIYFVEVKYRHTGSQGMGMDYITPSKLKKMSFAAEVWVHQHKWGGEYQLAVVSVDNDQFTLIDEL